MQTSTLAMSPVSDPVSPGSFSGPVIRNLLYHVWPVRGLEEKTWEWNIQRLLKRIDLFNGRRVIGIVHDGQSDDYTHVLEWFDGHGCEFFIAPNRPSGECVTFPTLLNRVQSDDPNEVTCYAHGKGVKYDLATTPYPEFRPWVRRWAEIQYRVCMDDWPGIRQQLQVFPITGSLKRRGRFTAHRRLVDWHYSGTFFWIRHQPVFARGPLTVHDFYGGTEIWPGLYFQDQEAGSLFLEFTDLSPYTAEFWDTLAVPELERWERGRKRVPVPPKLLTPIIEGYSVPRTEQLQSELEWFIGKLMEHNVRSILTIGAQHLGTEYHIARRFQMAKRKIAITTIEKEVKEPAIVTQHRIASELRMKCTLVDGDSSAPDTQARLDPHYDAVFVDGDHGYKGVRNDWLLALSRSPSLIGFHDIVNSDWHAQHGCCVDKLWREIKDAGYRTEETSHEDWGGIGLVLL